MTAEVQAFIEAEKQADGNVAKACELLDVSRSAFYDRLTHTPSAQELSDAELTEKIKTIHAASGGAYGAPRILDELREQGWHVSKKRGPADGRRWTGRPLSAPQEAHDVP